MYPSSYKASITSAIIIPISIAIEGPIPRPVAPANPDNT